MKTKTKAPCRCLNCNAVFSDRVNYCPDCGQETRERKLPFSVLFRDFLDDYFSVDSRFFITLLYLLGRPGFLTREFNRGRRVRYMPPLRMYLVISLIYFSLLSLTDFRDRTDRTFVNVGVAHTDTMPHIGFNLTINKDTIAFENKEVFIRQIEKQGMEAFMDSLHVEGSALKRFFIRQAISGALNEKTDLQDRFRNNASLMMFFLMPVMGLLLMLLYRSRKMYYIEHLIFSFHLHAFFFFILALMLIVEWITGAELSLYALIIALCYAFIALRTVYKGRKYLSLIRYAILFISYGLVILLFVGLTLAVSILAL